MTLSEVPHRMEGWGFPGSDSNPSDTDSMHYLWDSHPLANLSRGRKFLLSQQYTEKIRFTLYYQFPSVGEWRSHPIIFSEIWTLGGVLST